MRGTKVRFAVGLVTLLTACAGIEEPAQDRLWGLSCGLGNDCDLGDCIVYESRDGTTSGTCSTACEDDVDCPKELPVCGVGPGGQRVCSLTCDSYQYFTDSLFFEPANNKVICVDEIPTACSALSGECEVCGCSDGLRCDPSGDCLPLSDEGGPCRKDEDCRTANCGMYTGICRTPLGSPCDVTNCDLCLVSDGWSYCSRECGGGYGCGRDLCLGNAYEDFYWCRPRCKTFSDPSCPGDCDSADGELFCDMLSAHVVPPRPVGSICQSDSNCESNRCYLTELCFQLIGCNTSPGYCTAACSSDAECGSGLACVNVPCTPDETGTCGSICLRTCEADLPSPWESPCETEDDVCQRRSRVADGTAVSVCDVKRPNGKLCQLNASCASGRCESNVCVAAGGVANGGACVGHDDCLSGVCTSGACRGTALLGDSCGTASDCAAGTCCSGTCCMQ